MLPTVAEVLEFDVVRRGGPRLLAGADATSNAVRWVHVSELADIAHLLKGGELILTTGVALPGSPAGLRAYVDDLAGVRVAGLMVEMGRRFRGTLPPAIVGAADRAHLPLVTLAREVRFVQVTEAVHARIIDSHLEELRRSEQLHDVFTQLSLEGASVAEVLRQTARLGGMPVVLEDLTHQVVAVDPAGEDPEAMLEGWEERSRAAASPERVAYAHEAGLLVARVGARGEDWGRLAMVCDDEPGTTSRMLVEQATTALALGRLIERDRSSVRRQSERTLLATIVDDDVPDHEVRLRFRALGVPIAGRQLLGVTVRLWAHADTRVSDDESINVQAATRLLGESFTRSARAAGVPALVGVLEEGVVTALVSLPLQADADQILTQLSIKLGEGQVARPVVGVGSVGRDLADARRSIQESSQVAEVARHHPGAHPYHRLDDLGILGLLHLMRDDPRLQSFLERQLGRLLAREPRQRDKLLAALAAFLEAGGNKSTAAASLNIARSVLYERLSRVEKILGTNLSDPKQAVSLHVALLALDDTRHKR